jgi:hypothetical protein
MVELVLGIVVYTLCCEGYYQHMLGVTLGDNIDMDVLGD